MRCRVKYASGAEHSFVITPDAILATSDRPVMLPVLENDGRPLQTTATDRIVTTSYGTDQQTFIAVEGTLAKGNKPFRSTYGDLRPYRATGSVLIYPRNAQDPTSEAVLKSFRRTKSGFASTLGRVEADTYIGRTAAGGKGTSIDLNGDGKSDLTFGRECSFVIQLKNGMPTSIETDQDITAQWRDRRITLKAWTPTRLVN